MNKIYSCDIIMDLLPSYMEKLVSDETAEVIEEHIAQCDCCKEMYKQMDCDITLLDSERYKKKRKRRKKPGKAKVIILGYLLVLMLIFTFIMCDMIFGA